MDNVTVFVPNDDAIQDFTRDLEDSELVQSENSEKNRIRLTVYPTRPEPTVMANCAKVLSRDNHASNGIVQVVDKVIVPAVGTIADVLASDLHFGTFVAALEKADLARMLSEEEGHFTV